MKQIYEMDGLEIEVEVIEEVSHFGRNDIRIKPVAGNGTKVVAKHKVKQIEDETN